MQETAGIVLAAGRGTRMGVGHGPKVLVPLSGRPLVAYPLAALRDAGARLSIVVVGYLGEQVRRVLDGLDFTPLELRYAEQPEPRGTGHALQCALPSLPEAYDQALVLSGDVPLVAVETLRALVHGCRRSTAGCALATFRPADPQGYGRILRDSEGAVRAIREERDATAAERRVSECNAGVYCFRVSVLRRELFGVGSSNAQGEIYLTDLIERLSPEGEIFAHEVGALEVEGVNTPEQLARLQHFVQVQRG